MHTQSIQRTLNLNNKKINPTKKLAKELNRQTPYQRYIQMENNYMKIYSASFVIRKMQIKMQIKNDNELPLHTYFRIAKIQAKQ